MGWAEDFNKGKVKADPVYTEPGQYHVKLVKVAEGMNRKQKKNFIVQAEVLTSTNKNRPVGCVMSWVMNYDYDSTIDDVKTFIYRVSQAVNSEVSQEEITSDVYSSVIGEDQLFAGIEMDLTVLPPKEGKAFCKAVWSAPLKKSAA